MVLQASATQLFEAEPFLMDLHLLQPTIMTYAFSQTYDSLPFSSQTAKRRFITSTVNRMP